MLFKLLRRTGTPLACLGKRTMTDTPQGPKVTIGSVKGLEIRCISETGWFDGPQLVGDLMAIGGMSSSQYATKWEPFGNLHKENSGGSSALLQVENLDGSTRNVLLDCGWGAEWMDSRFKATGVDILLRENMIDSLIISHEHFDHFWGIPAALKYCPSLTIFVPYGFQDAGFDLIRRSGHTGQVVVVPKDQNLSVFPGLTISHFNVPCSLKVVGENVLFFHIEDKGLAVVTGCSHAGILRILDHAKNSFTEGNKIHALYGGLHLSPMGDWDDAREKVLDELATRNIDKIACNHCTGLNAVKKMRERGMSIIEGSGSHRSQSQYFVGNGDKIVL